VPNKNLSKVEDLTAALRACLPGSPDFSSRASGVLAAAKRSGDQSAMADVYQLIGRHRYFTNDLAGASEAFRTAGKYANDVGDPEKEIRALRALGMALSVANDQAGAKRAIDQSLHLATKYNDPRLIALANSGLATWYANNALYGQAVHYAERSYEALRGTADEAQALYQIGHLLFQAENVEQALVMFHRSLELYRSQQSIAGAQQALLYIGVCHAKLGNFDAARKHCLEVLDSDSQNGSVMRYEILKELAEIEIKAGDLIRASELVDEVYQYFTENGPDSTLAEVLRLAASIELQGGAPRKALVHLHGYTVVRKRMNTPLEAEAYSLFADAYEQLDEWKETAGYLRQAQLAREKILSDTFLMRANAIQISLATEREQHERELEKQRADRAEGDLVSIAATLAAQTEDLTNFSAELRSVIRTATEPVSALKKVSEKLRDFSRHSIDWIKFEKQFSAVHPEFRSKIVERFPELTKQEVRLCLLAKLGLKTQDMARLLCISNRTVDRHRNSLRKKMLLKPSESLHEFLQSV